MVVVAAVAALLGGASAVRADDDDVAGNYVQDAGWKLFRGVTNVVTGIPAEVLTHAGGGVSGPQATTIGAAVTGLLAGVVTGTAYGFARMGSGVADVATFPLPFIPLDHNRPLVEPEFKL
jgi:putative exosortase-associated protein (TIGR04073 family)